MTKYASNISLQERLPDVSGMTDVDGGIYGVRYFNVYPASAGGAFLISPTSKFVWESKFGIAADFANGVAVRGHSGFHAAWPETLERWADSWVDHHECEVKALVKGSGDLVQGTMGWRSEKLEVVSMVCQHEKHVTPLVARYGVQVRMYRPPTIAIEACTIEWTSEFQVVMDTLEPRVRARKADVSKVNF